MDWNVIINEILAAIGDIALKLVASLIVLTVGRLLIKWIVKLIMKSKFAKKTDETVMGVLINFINAGLYVLLTVSIIGILGVPMASVIAVIASAGVAIGLALQGALSNLAGGIMIMILRPFHLGNYVEIGDNAGTVKDVGIFYTVLNTPDNKVITVPNGTVMAEEIVNYSQNDTRRVDFVFTAAYGSDVEKVKSVLLDEATKHALVLSDPAPMSRLSEQGDSALHFVLRVWTKKDDYWTVKFDLMESITKRFETEGIDVPFNQLDVRITQ